VLIGDGLSTVGEGEPAGKQQGSIVVVPGTIFVVAHQGISPAGKLNPDLMAAAGVEPDMHQGAFATD
jgi:hypothetical protein